MSMLQYFPLRSKQGAPGSGVTAVPSSLYRYSPTAGSTLTAGPVVVTAVFGTGPYTYAWSNTGPHITADSPTSASTTFTCTGRGFASDDICNALCTVTDSLAAVAYVSVNVEFQIGGLPK